MPSPRRMTLLILNRMHGLRDSAVVLLAMALFVSLANGAFGVERPFTVDDLVKLSGVGKAAVQPGTNTFVWEQSPPYDTLGDYGAGTAGTWQGGDYEIFTVDSGSIVPRKLFQPLERTTYLLGDFSKDGRFLTLLATRDGEVRTAVFDFQWQRLREFPLAPRFLLSADWAWLDNRHLAIAAYPDGGGPWPFTFRRGIGSHLTRSWEKSWRGQEASVDQYDSSANDVDRPLPGRLVVVDVDSGHIEQLASGRSSQRFARLRTRSMVVGCGPTVDVAPIYLGTSSHRLDLRSVGTDGVLLDRRPRRTRDFPGPRRASGQHGMESIGQAAGLFCVACRNGAAKRRFLGGRPIQFRRRSHSTRRPQSGISTSARRDSMAGTGGMVRGFALRIRPIDPGSTRNAGIRRL